MCASPFGQQCKAIRQVPQVGEGLGRDRTQGRTHARHDSAGREELARDSHAPAVSVGASRHDREGHGRRLSTGPVFTESDRGTGRQRGMTMSTVVPEVAYVLVQTPHRSRMRDPRPWVSVR